MAGGVRRQVALSRRSEVGGHGRFADAQRLLALQATLVRSFWRYRGRALRQKRRRGDIAAKEPEVSSPAPPARAGQRPLYGMKDELMDRTTVAETHFGLGRMDVNVDRSPDRPRQRCSRPGNGCRAACPDRLRAARGWSSLSRTKRPFDVTVLGVAARARVRWRRAVAEDTQAVALSAIRVAQRFAGVD